MELDARFRERVAADSPVLSEGALYHYFAEKDALHDATIDYFFTRFLPEEDARSGHAPAEAILSETGEGLIALTAEVARITPDTAA